MDTLISIAIERNLKPADIETLRHEAGYSVSTFCNAFARRVAKRYLEGDLSWPDADSAMNNIFELMTVHCDGTLPDYGWNVYLAFDAGEYQKPGGDVVTKRLLAAMSHERSA